MQFSRSIVIENLAKDTWMSIEKILAHNWIIISERFGESGQSGSRNFLERCLLVVVQCLTKCFMLTRCKYMGGLFCMAGQIHIHQWLMGEMREDD